ncbi:MAG: hypothetical protein ABIQ52_12010 [Vicinamibacterales bacterium]
MSPEIALMISPRRTYAALAQAPRSTPILVSLRRPALAALVLGVSLAMAATGRVTPALVLSTTLCWSFAVAIQAAVALVLIAGPARKTVGVPRAFDLFFAGHAPWSLWLLAVAAWAPSQLGRPLTPILVAAIVPLALTVRIVSAFFVEVLELDRRDALLRTGIHQLAIWGVLSVLFATAVQLVPRVLGWIA